MLGNGRFGLRIEIFKGDEELIGFVRRFAGYSLTGSTEERCLAILHGSGKNGKTTFIELLHHVLGDYAQSTDVETVLAKRYQGVGNDVAALKGARFVSTSEVDKGRRLAESKVKQLTGSDTISARFLFSEPFNFRPEFKLWINTNNKPEIKGTDNAIWDRIRLIPFVVRFEGKDVDKDLPRKHTLSPRERSRKVARGLTGTNARANSRDSNASAEKKDAFSEVGKYRLCPCSCRMYVCKGRGRRMGRPPFGDSSLPPSFALRRENYFAIFASRGGGTTRSRGLELRSKMGA